MGTSSITYNDFNIEEFFAAGSLSGLRAKESVRKYKKGDYIFMQNAEHSKVYFVKKGLVKIGNFSSTGKEITKQLIVENELFGELTIIGQERYDDFAIALSDVEILTLDVDYVRAEMLRQPKLSNYIMTLIGIRLLQVEKRLERVAFENSRTRIIEFLKDLAIEKGKSVGYEILVNGFLPHQEIANITATSRQTVTTTLNELRSENLIYFNRKKLLIRDKDLSKLV